MEKLIFNLVGNPGSGKSTLAAYMAQRYDFAVVRPSKLISEYASLHDIPLNSRVDYVAVHALMRMRLGDDIFAEHILNQGADLVCVDGLRVPIDVARIKNHGAKVVALWCPIRERFQRRLLESPGLTFEQFKNDQMPDYHSSSYTEPSTITVMGNADYHIDTSRPLPRVLQDIEVIVEKS